MRTDEKNQMEDMEFIEACAHNEPASQKIFYERYSQVVMGMCTRYAGCEKEAGAMALYVFTKLFENISECPIKEGSEKWIEEEIIWNAIQYLHGDKHKYFIAKTTLYGENRPVYFKEIGEVVLPDDLGKQIYLSSLQALTPSYRILYNLTYIDEIPPEKILDNLQMAKDTYKVEVDEARYQFKKLLTKSLNEQNLQ